MSSSNNGIDRTFLPIQAQQVFREFPNRQAFVQLNGSDPSQHPPEVELLAYIQGQGTDGRRAEIYKHLMECQSCMAQARGLSKQRQGATSLEQAGASTSTATQRGAHHTPAPASPPSKGSLALESSSKPENAPTELTQPQVSLPPRTRSPSGKTVRKPSRQPRRKEPNFVRHLIAASIPMALTLIVCFAFRDKLSYVLGLSDPETNNTGKIVLRDIPEDVELLIDGRRANFVRPAAGKPAEIDAEPGTYTLTIIRGGKQIKQQTVTVGKRQAVQLSLKEQKIVPQDPPRGNPEPAPPANNNLASQMEDPKAPIRIAANKPEPKRDQFNLSPIEIDRRLDSALSYLKRRQANAARQTIRNLIVSQDEHALPDTHSRWPKARALLECIDALEAFIKSVDSALGSLDAGEVIRVNNKEVAVIEADANGIALKIDGGTHRYGRRSFPNLLEQGLADLKLGQEYAIPKFAKALGLLTCGRLSEDGEELSDLWLQEAFQATNSLSDRELIALKDLCISFKVDANRQVAGAPLANMGFPAGFMENPLLRRMQPERPVDPFASEFEEDPNADFERYRDLTKELRPIGGLFFLSRAISKDSFSNLFVSQLGLSEYSSTLTSIWNTRTGVKISENSPSGPVWQIRNSKNGRILVALGNTATREQVRVFAPPSTKALQQIRFPCDIRADMCLSSDGRQLAFCSAEELFVHWNLQTGKEVARMAARSPLGETMVAATALRPDLRQVAVADTNGKLHVWSTTTGEAVTLDDSVKADHGPIFDLFFARTSRSLILLNRNGRLTETKTPSYQVEKQTDPTEDELVISAISENRKFLVTIDMKHRVRIWDVDRLEIVGRFTEPSPAQTTALAIDADGNMVGLGFTDGHVKLWKRK